jgi:hypothetical protein
VFDPLKFLWKKYFQAETSRKKIRLKKSQIFKLFMEKIFSSGNKPKKKLLKKYQNFKNLRNLVIDLKNKMNSLIIENICSEYAMKLRGWFY